MTELTDAEKSSNDIQYQFITTFSKLEIECFQLDKKVIYKIPIANIILNGKILEALPLRLGTSEGCPSKSNKIRKGSKRHID